MSYVDGQLLLGHFVKALTSPRITPPSHGYVPLKDAPGFRNLPVDQTPRKLVKGDQLHETSLSDQRGDEKAGNTLVALDDGSGKGKPVGSAAFSGSARNTAVGPGAGSSRFDSVSQSTADLDTAGGTGTGSRPALEMSMYILLGLFALVGLALLHRDTNWVWIGRDKTGEGQNDQNETAVPSSMGDCHRSANSPLLGMTEASKAVSAGAGGAGSRGPRSGPGASGRKSANPSSNTTAVLSVGEADMLLMHSPYHQDAWQDTLRSSNTDRDDMTPFAMGWPYPGPPGSVQDSRGLSAASATVGRPSRRHTTGVLTQRNYQEKWRHTDMDEEKDHQA
ncbi:unnamed protein product [Echinostoma caproni]|uniref:Transmembrane protein n=1 Tax=Echinostoma caproni TaxID=27848 RepID=A0A183AZL2_9TREM|nr:unnamed protein product [Echinostoma caproni]